MTPAGSGFGNREFFGELALFLGLKKELHHRQPLGGHFQPNGCRLGDDIYLWENEIRISPERLKFQPPPGKPQIPDLIILKFLPDDIVWNDGFKVVFLNDFDFVDGVTSHAVPGIQSEKSIQWFVNHPFQAMSFPLADNRNRL